MTLFDDDAALGLDADLIAQLREAYNQRLLDNPPTPAFMETNPKREQAAKWATKRDVDRFLAVLSELGLAIKRGPK